MRRREFLAALGLAPVAPKALAAAAPNCAYEVSGFVRLPVVSGSAGLFLVVKDDIDRMVARHWQAMDRHAYLFEEGDRDPRSEPCSTTS